MTAHGKKAIKLRPVSYTPDIAPDLLYLALNLKNSREQRSYFFATEMFGEAGWDMLLALYIARGRGYRLKISDACFESRVPASTALRWLDFLERSDLVERQESPLDRRTVLLDLSTKAVGRMNDYLSSVSSQLSHH